MADNGSIFGLEVFSEGWFAKEAQPHGWFDQDALDPTLSGGASFSGAASLVLNQAGSLLAPASLNGVAVLALSQTGDFNAATLAGGANFAGTAGFVFGQSGVLAASSSMSGVADISFSQTASLLSTVNFLGSATLTFGQSGTFSAAPDSNSPPNTGGGAGPVSTRRYHRRYDPYEVEDSLKQVLEATRRPQTRNARKRHPTDIGASIKRVTDQLRGSGYAPVIISDMQAVISDDGLMLPGQAFAQWRDNVVRLANQALAEIRAEIELAEEEDSDLLLLLA